MTNTEKAPGVYLAGAITLVSETYARKWRDHAKDVLLYYGFRPLDPLRHGYDNQVEGSDRMIVQTDLADIRDSKFVIVNAMSPSWGTAMEMFYAFNLPRRVITIAPDGISPWVLAHSNTVKKTLEGALQALITIEHASPVGTVTPT